MHGQVRPGALAHFQNKLILRGFILGGHTQKSFIQQPHLSEEGEHRRPVPRGAHALVVALHERLTQSARARPVRPRHHVDAVRVRRGRLAGEAAVWKEV